MTQNDDMTLRLSCGVRIVTLKFQVRNLGDPTVSKAMDRVKIELNNPGGLPLKVDHLYESDCSPYCNRTSRARARTRTRTRALGKSKCERDKEVSIPIMAYSCILRGLRARTANGNCTRSHIKIFRNMLMAESCRKASIQL